MTFLRSSIDTPSTGNDSRLEPPPLSRHSSKSSALEFFYFRQNGPCCLFAVLIRHRMPGFDHLDSFKRQTMAITGKDDSVQRASRWPS